MRHWLVQEMGAELLGPRGGSHETIESRPELLYSLGVLSPSDDSHNDESDLSQDELVVDDSSGTQDGGGPGFHEAPAFNPGLDPKSYPPSMGISFTCSSEDGPPDFDLAVTYARYVPDGESYSRVPRGALIPINGSEMTEKGKDLRQRIYLSPDGNEIGSSPVLRVVEESNDAETMLFFRMRQTGSGIWTVTAILRSMIDPADDFDTRSQTMIFQPEIRIRARGGTEVVEASPVSTSPDGPSTEEEIDDLLYSGRRQVARGLLCSATWRDFDPQDISDEDRRKMEECVSDDGLCILDSPPFSWTDRNHPAFANELVGLYPPDVRTEYMPMLNIPAPDMDPTDQTRGTSDDPITPSWKIPITALELSEASSGPEIKAILEPLVKGYEEWLDHTFSHGDSLDRELRPQAQECVKRMKNGLDILERDPAARLAFNMANRAIYVSNRWASDWDLSWRKFQIAFVLSAIESTTNRWSDDRDNLDLLWVATGGGKTEAYLLLMAYVLCMRRIRPSMDQSGNARSNWQGVNVITRYTLRLLTIQQFRRTLGVITAMEWLRSGNCGDGWSPEEYDGEPNPWGEQPFGIGIWVGGAVTPNMLGHVSNRGRTNRAGIVNGFRDRYFDPRRMKALEHLEAGHHLSDAQSRVAAEPAQVLSCPCCSASLSYPRASEDSPKVREAPVHWVVANRSRIPMRDIESRISVDPEISRVVTSVSSIDHGSAIHTLTLQVNIDEGLDEKTVEDLWDKVSTASNGMLDICSTRASRPGYFYLTRTVRTGTMHNYDFVIHCPDPSCDLNKTEWTGRMPAGRSDSKATNPSEPECTDEGYPVDVPLPWRAGADTLSRGVPIPAYTVDEQIYSRLPSVVISTVDKFARMPFEPRAGAIFGNVDLHSELHGFCREGAKTRAPDGIKGISGISDDFRECRITPIPGGLDPPELIIQDELHLIEGPLGSMVGFYETLVERLISERYPTDSKPKYVASTATIRSAEPQVQCLFDRRLSLFPPKGRRWDDRGLIREKTGDPHSDGDNAGRLYIGLCPVGTSGLGFQRDLYSVLLHNSKKMSGDRFWTIVGYYNAVRELSGARALMDQDIVGALGRLSIRDGVDQREIRTLLELSGRLESTQLPIILDQLEELRRGEDGSVDSLLTTSMFGTGVDVNRLNVMVVAGQPKTTSQYIQATGRVGRRNGSLIATYLRSARPRDLDHFERFLSYHLRLNSSVEPVTVRPFSLPVISRAAGPLMVGWIRNSREAVASGIPWATTTSPSMWNSNRNRPPEFDDFIEILEDRNQAQTEERRIRQAPPNAIHDIIEGGQGRWQILSTDAQAQNREIRWSLNRSPSANPNDPSEEVMGEEIHIKQPAIHRAVYSPDHPAPQSLRTVDSNIGVQARGEN